MNLLKFLLEEYEHEARHRIAQYNAALPIEQGGLGLHKDNTSMDRAKALGFDTKAYHATDKDFSYFDMDKASTTAIYGSGIYVSYTPEHNWGKNKEGLRVIPLLVKRDKVLPSTPLSSINAEKISKYIGRNISPENGLPLLSIERKAGGDLAKGVEQAGFSGFDHPAPANRNSEIHTVFRDKTAIRSIHAAFDPMKKDSDDLLD